MKKKIDMKNLGLKLLAMSFLAMSFASCVKDPAELPAAGSNKLQVQFTIPDQVPGSYATVGTFPSERLFDEAYVIFYDVSGLYVAHAPSSVVSDSKVGSFEVVKPAAVEFDKPYKMLVVANMKHYLDRTKYASTNDYLNDKTSVRYETMYAEISATSNNRVSNHLPMYAHAEATLTESSAAISVVFERAVARFDLVSLAQNLDIEWVKVCNYNNAGYFYHNDYNVVGSSIINGAGANDLEAPNPHKVNLERRKDAADGLAAQANTAGGLYAFSNVNVNTGVNDQKTTCLLFKGTYSYTDKDGKPQTKEGYYRVNVCMPGKPQNLKRNNIYRITVKAVTDGGKDSEDEGMKNPTANVDYEINDWEIDNSQEIITDDKGNYLAVAPVSAYIGGGIGSSLTGSVRVKNGSSWSIEKLVPGDTWFSVGKTADDKGFILTALEENSNNNFRSSKVRVKVLGTTLQYDIFVYQYSVTISKDVILIIDGRLGDFSVDVHGNGQTHKFQVLLGDNSASARMSWVSGATDMILSSNPPVGLPGIGNNTTLNLVLGANATGAARTSTYKVVRSDGKNTDMESLITFNQEPTTDLIMASPTVLFDKNTLDGFMNLTGGGNATKCHYQRVTVMSRDMVKYPKWKATSTFNTYDVALVSKPSVPTTTYPSGAALLNTAVGANSDWFDIAVSRCGPGDASLSGTITIEGCDNAGKVVPGAVYTYPLTVYSSLKSGFTQIGTVLYHDRNVGAPDYLVTDESAISPALPYSNFAGDYQSRAASLTDHKLFKGAYFTFSAAQLQCPPGWRTPTNTEYTAVATAMQWAKAGGRPYVVANNGADKDAKGCHFPLSGYGTYPSNVTGYYWSSTPTIPNDGYILSLRTSAASASDSGNSGQYSVRCVRGI